MRFRTPPKCADAVLCVRALGGGRKRRGGMAVCLKGRIASQHLVSSCLFGWSGGGCVFEHPPNVLTRFIAFALWGVGGNAEVGWPGVLKGRIVRSANRKAKNNLVGGLPRTNTAFWNEGCGCRGSAESKPYTDNRSPSACLKGRTSISASR